jgi:hypothetical protein
MKTIIRLVLVILALGCAVRLAFSVTPDARGAQSPESAAIVPVSSFSVGNSLCCGSNGAGYGYSLYANGITDYWSTANPGTVDLIVFVYPGQQNVKQRIAVQITSPSGAVVYSNKFAAQSMGYEGDWFSLIAKGNYGTPGVYTVSVSTGKTVIGHVPLVFAPPSNK